MCNEVCNNRDMQTQSFERINILLPRDTAKQLRSAVPRGQRSQFVKKAIERQLSEKKKDMYGELLRVRKTGPKVSLEGIVRWVRQDRQSH